jgi:hypothetical protein
MIACAGCGRFLAAIPRYTEINQPVTNQEIVGEWLLTTNSLAVPRVDGLVVKGNEKFSITIRSDGSCSYHSIIGKAYKESEGRWSLQYDATNTFKNQISFSVDGVGFPLKIAFDSKDTVLWQSWGDPDAGVDLVYKKKLANN